MLVLSRKEFQRVRLRDKRSGLVTWVTLVEVDRGKVRVGFAAGDDVEIIREELLPASEQFPQPGEDRGNAQE